MKKLLLSLLVAFTLVGCNSSQQQVSSAANVLSEEIKPDIPPQFQEGFRQKTDNNATIIEYIPYGQTVESWKEIITVQYFPINHLTAEQYYYSIGNAMSKICQNFSMDKALTVTGGGYTIVRGATYCGQNPMSKRGEFTNFSVIKGKTGIHILQRAIRVLPFVKGTPPLDNQTLVAWAKFFNNSTLCAHRADNSIECVGI